VKSAISNAVEIKKFTYSSGVFTGATGANVSLPSIGWGQNGYQLQTIDCIFHKQSSSLFLVVLISNGSNSHKIGVLKFDQSFGFKTGFGGDQGEGITFAYRPISSYLPVFNKVGFAGPSDSRLVITGAFPENAIDFRPALWLFKADDGSFLSDRGANFSWKHSLHEGATTSFAVDPVEPNIFYPVGYSLESTHQQMSVWSVQVTDDSTAPIAKVNQMGGLSVRHFNTSTTSSSWPSSGYDGNDRAFDIVIHPGNHFMYIGGQAEFTNGQYSPVMWLLH
jgi:hypothetical protein